ncbi:MAG: hypothetical protein WCI19_01085 [Betaproteobacteria bacterium]|nr:hypothetical protein [Rhodocyclales bacterium]
MTERAASVRHCRGRRKSAAGFSLVEVLIGTLLSMVTFLIMFQMFDSWDKNRRSTSAGGGAAVTGALALFRLERDLRLAGFGFGNAVELGCTVNAYDATRANEAASSSGAVSATSTHAFSFPLVPFQIYGGTAAAGSPQQIATLYGSSEASQATRFAATAAAGAQPYTDATTTSTQMDVGALGNIQQGDLVIMAQETTPYLCDLMEVTNNGLAGGRIFEHKDSTQGDYCHFYTDTHTPPCALPNTNLSTNTTPRFNNPGFAGPTPTGRIYVLGPRPQRRVWQIRNGRTLAFANDLPTYTVSSAGVVTAEAVNEFTDVADNIINLQAQYVFSSTAPAACTASATWRTDTPSAACQGSVWAVRIALLARSDQFEKTWGVPVDATGFAVAPRWSGGSFGMSNLNTVLNADGSVSSSDCTPARDCFTTTTLATQSKDPKDWRHYRYRVLESIVPLKNVMWGSR